ncbi:MAG: peptide ABC transporter substrate-binding protein [Candidatus Eremiobacteraeota bacterium]|nr:peptide ABC transporter substrate-binding protein [Candidatus Eremiobacteraeota bacterium]
MSAPKALANDILRKYRTRASAAARIAIALSLASALLSGCTRLSSSTPGGRHPWTRPHVLRLADVAGPDSLNPLLSTMDLSYDLSSLLFSYLIVAGRSGALQGDLAISVPSVANGGISRDGRTYVYRLRAGVRWHDGVPLTSRDVAFSWRAIMSPHNNVLHREGYEEVSTLATPDARTVVVRLRRRYPPFVTQFFTTLQEGAKPIVPEHVLGRLESIGNAPFNAHPIGSGPFRFVRWDRGTRIVLARNEQFFAGRSKLDRIELTIVSDENTVMTLMRTHAIDMPVSTSPLAWHLFQGVPGVRARLDPWNSQMVLALNNARPALRDPAIRQAVAAAIDYGALIEKLTYGSGERASDVVAPSSLGYANNAPYAHDPSRARALLDTAGWHVGDGGVRAKNGVPLDLVMVIAAKGTAPFYAVQLQRMLHDVGIRVTVKTYPYNGVYAYDGPIVTGNYDLAIYANTLPYDPDRTSTLSCDQFTPKGENEVHFCAPAVDALERAGLRTDDPAQRGRIYRQAGRLIYAATPYIALLAQRRPAIANDDLRGYDPSPVAAPWWNANTWDI